MHEVVGESLRRICHLMDGMCKLMHFHMSQWMCTQHIFRSAQIEVDVNRLMSKHNSDYNVIFCHDP